MKKLAILGSTGSVGCQVLGVVRRNLDRFRIVSLAANDNLLIKEQIDEFSPTIATMESVEAAKNLSPSNTRIFSGKDSYLSAITEDADLVVLAMSGFVGLKAALLAVEMGKDIAIANKESLVAGGELIMRRAKEKNVHIIPLDTEHSAIFQCLNYKLDAPFSKLILTASGGPFKYCTLEEMSKIKAADAIKHPVWRMGKKISIDSATLMNKGLEVIEAKRLMSCETKDIEVVVHPEGIIHSMVEFADGAVLAQLSTPVLDTAISIAITYPERVPSPTKRLNFAEIGKLTFLPLDEKKFPCYSLALKAEAMGDNYPCALSAADEAAVGLFLEDKIGFLDICGYVMRALEKTERLKADCYEALELTDKRARSLVIEDYIKNS